MGRPQPAMCAIDPIQGQGHGPSEVAKIALY